jgi:hypothetical protein
MSRAEEIAAAVEALEKYHRHLDEDTVARLAKILIGRTYGGGKPPAGQPFEGNLYDGLNGLARLVPWEGGTDVAKFGLSPGTVNALRRNGLHTLDDLRARPDRRMQVAHGFGEKAARELRGALLEAFNGPIPGDVKPGSPVLEALPEPNGEYMGFGERPLDEP